MKYLVTYVELDGLDEVGDGIPEFQLSESEKIEITNAVSYTHLTLPTTTIV